MEFEICAEVSELPESSLVSDSYSLSVLSLIGISSLDSKR